MNIDITSKLDFPSAKIIPKLPELFTKIAPEKRNQILNDTKNVTFNVTDGDEWRCEALKNYGLIVISRKTVEIVWAFCFSFYTIYKELLNNVKPEGQYINMLDKPELKTARDLLTWGIDNLTKKERSDLSGDFSFINDKPRYGSDEHVILEITLCTLAFFLHHELAHIKFAGISFKSTIQEEEKCDIEAAKVILETSNKAEKEKRCFGVSTGLLLINSIGFKTKNFDGIEHPFSYDRLINTLVKFVNEDDKIWSWTVGILSLHLTNYGIEQPKEEFDNFYKCVIKHKALIEEYKDK